MIREFFENFKSKCPETFKMDDFQKIKKKKFLHIQGNMWKILRCTILRKIGAKLSSNFGNNFRK